jgi:hypothetical protein
MGVALMPKSVAVRYGRRAKLQVLTLNESWISQELRMCVRSLESAPKAAALRRPPPRGGGETLGAARRLFLMSLPVAAQLFVAHLQSEAQSGMPPRIARPAAASKCVMASSSTNALRVAGESRSSGRSLAARSMEN